MKWLRVNHKNRCPICNHADWCGYSADGELAICMRIESKSPTRNGGWTHVLKERSEHPPLPRPKPPVPEPEEPKLEDIDAIIAHWRGFTSQELINGLVESLEVTESALRRLDAVWSPDNRAWAFPMRDGSGKTVGIRLRSNDGFKWAVKGSKSGLFLPAGLERKGRLLVVEGPTDTAAALSFEYDAIGRPSCQGNHQEIIDFIRASRYTDIVLIADLDKKDKRTGRRPGMSGANALAKAISRPVRIVIPPHKDMRKWWQSGAKRKEVNSIINNVKPRRRK